MLCYIILSSSGNYQCRYKQSGRISGAIAGETSSTSIRFLRTNSHLLAIYFICHLPLVFISPTSKTFLQKYKNIFRCPFSWLIFLCLRSCLRAYYVSIKIPNCVIFSIIIMMLLVLRLLLPPLVRSLRY